MILLALTPLLAESLVLQVWRIVQLEPLVLLGLPVLTQLNYQHLMEQKILTFQLVLER